MNLLRAVVAGCGLVVAAVVLLRFEPGTTRGDILVEDPEVTARAVTWSDADWTSFADRVRWAGANGVDTLPIGRAMAEIGRTFVGTPYAASTLEVDGPERVVVNFQGLDCVTFVENTFALARFVREGGARLLDRRTEAEAAYERLLEDVRYRGGRLSGYPSRLHYFSEWIADNARRGRVEDIAEALGGIRDDEPIDFMTRHLDAYRQLSDSANVARIREAEVRLSSEGRRYIPQDDVAAAAHGIQDGDIIAATSTLPGLDVAHTGLALWVDGSLHLLHAPLVGDSVEISRLPLAERLVGITSQDGIMVARPRGN